MTCIDANVFKNFINTNVRHFMQALMKSEFLDGIIPIPMDGTQIASLDLRMLSGNDPIECASIFIFTGHIWL